MAYGTKSGTVGLIDGDGTRLWEAAFKGEISAVGLADKANICAVLYRPHQEPLNTRLACIGENGQIDWEYASEQNLLGLSLSPDGKYLATGARNGTVSVYAVVFGEGTGGASIQAGRAGLVAGHQYGANGRRTGRVARFGDRARRRPV